MFENIPLTLVLAQDDTPPAAADTPKPAPAANESTTTQKTTDQTTTTDDDDAPRSLFGDGIFPMLMIAFVIMIIFSMRGSSREKKKRDNLIASLKKGDRVQTVGGIIGTIVQIRDTDVVVKVDENTGAKISFSRSAVQTVLEEKEE